MSEQGCPVAHVVKQLNISQPPPRATGYNNWILRWRDEGPAELHDRSGRAHHVPSNPPEELGLQVLALRRDGKLGPARIGPPVGLPILTIHAVLRRHAMHRLARLDRPTGERIRRYERDQPGGLTRAGVEILGVIRRGSGRRAHAPESV